MRKRVLSLLVVLLVATLTLADDTKKAGLKAGDDLPGPFRPYNVTGKWGERTIKDLGGRDRDVEGQFHCLLCEYGLAPFALVFVRNANLDQLAEDSPLLDLLKRLNAAVEKNRKTRLGSFAVFLSDELPDVVTDDEKRFELSRKLKDKVDKGAELKLGENLPLALESKKYLADYPLDDKAQVTVVLCKDLRVVHTFSFAPDELTKEAVDNVLAKVHEMIGVTKK